MKLMLSDISGDDKAVKRKNVTISSFMRIMATPTLDRLICYFHISMLHEFCFIYSCSVAVSWIQSVSPVVQF